MPGALRIGGAILLVAPISLLAQPSLGQPGGWQNAIAKVTTRSDLNQRPGTAFVVAITSDRAFLVTAAHVVAGDPKPAVWFLADPERSYEADVRNPEFDDKRGLALLVVRNAPAGISALRESADLPPSLREPVTVAGYPSVLDTFSAVDTAIASERGRDLFLSRDVGEGFSGGPVLREGDVAGIYYGSEGSFGVALKASSIRVYLQEGGVSWGVDAATAAKPPTPAKPSGPQPGEVRTNPVDGLPYVWIPPGEFDMGCSPGDTECSDDEKPSHRVRISKGFWLGQTEVTQAAYEKVVRENPSNFKGADLPVESVTWDEARKYCAAVNGRLPTEAEWEYAARAGSTQPRYGELDAIAWFGLNSGGRTREVRTKQPNAWGLYDMPGNVVEWVSDWYASDYYKSSPSTDPKGPERGEVRVLRGGSWGYIPRIVRSSSRYRLEPEYRNFNIGFRCVRE